MSEWREMRIGDYADTFAGGTPDRGDESLFGGTIPWIKSTEVNLGRIKETEEFLSEKGLQRSAAKWIPANSVLVAMYGATAAQVAYLEIEATANQAVLAICPREQLDSLFLYYALTSAKHRLLFLAQGSGQPNLNKQIVDRFEVPAPLPPQQRRIATILTTLDEVIEATEKLVEKHQQIKAGLMHDLFTRGLWTRPELARGDHKGLPCEAAAQEGQLRPTPEVAPGLYQDSPLGLIPKEWEPVSFGSLFETIYRYPTYFGITYVESGVVEVRGEMLNDDGTISDDARFITPDTALGFPKVLLEPGDVVMSVRGTIGKTGLVTGKEAGGVITANMLRLKPNRSLAFSPWVFAFMRTPMFSDALDKACSQTTIKTIQMPALMRIAVGKPTIEEQESACLRLEAQNALIAVEKKHLAKLRQQKQGLMHDLLTGRVRVAN